jgi:hypothetical protein
MGMGGQPHTIWSDEQVQLIVERTARLLWKLNAIEARITSLEIDLDQVAIPTIKSGIKNAIGNAGYFFQNAWTSEVQCSLQSGANHSHVQGGGRRAWNGREVPHARTDKQRRG